MSRASVTGLASACLGLSAGFGAAFLFPLPERVIFVAVGQGDCAVIQAGGHTVLIDSGPRTPSFDAGERIVVPRLHRWGIDRVDLLLLSHPDLDHIGGTGALVRAFPGIRIAMSDQFQDEPTVVRLMKEWNVPRESVIWLGRRSQFMTSNLHGNIFCPPWDSRTGNNDGSMFVRASLRTGAATFSGDAPKHVETLALQEGNWVADILKLGHHGSASSSGVAWLTAVHPRYAIVSAGLNNAYGHPHPSVLNALRQLQIPVARTDRDGDLMFDFRTPVLKPRRP